MRTPLHPFPCLISISAILFAFGLPTAPAAGADAASEWSAGVATAKITPAKPVPLAGYSSRTKVFESVDQDIYAKALALRDGQGNRALIVTIDLCDVPRDVGRDMQQRIVEKTQIDGSAVLLNFSHSHSTPVVSFDANPEPGQTVANQQASVEYTRWLCDRLVELAEEAQRHMQPVALSWGAGVANFAMNRRQFTEKGVTLGANPRGLADRSVPVLRVDGAGGKPLAVVFGYACHNTTMPANRLAISGDYEGYAREYIQQHVPGAVAMFMIGCAGDIDPFPRTGVQFAKDHGEELGREVCRVIEAKLQPVHGPLKCAAIIADLPLQTPTREALEAMLQSGSRLDKEAARQMLAKLAREGKLPAVYPAPVAAWQFGKDLTLVALPDEVVVGYVPRIEQAVGPMHLWISAYNAEVAGYIPSARILQEGGYESRGLFFDTGWFAPGVEDALVNAARAVAEKAGREMGAVRGNK